ncbi:uncharacterized protein LOC134234672, partial [Saccostrea cucullata]|uniref:uncharacterized protein LOC134234672 n=1 Tax=Saccostrea cuccullata TaxID=36930 RepID=UPI002ECFBDF9
MTNPFWGPYLSNRQWGTVREDTSSDGNSWESFPFEDARKRSYKHGEDGMFGFCDSSGTLITRLSLWNHKDEFLKERFFGLSGPQGNHGEDIKEVFYYLDGLPDHSYMKALYRYPQNEFPYDELLQMNLERNEQEPEFELTDTGIFDDNEYFDVMVEYGKDPENERNLVCCYTITNHSDQSAELTVLPQFLCKDYHPISLAQDGKTVRVDYSKGKFGIRVDCDQEVYQDKIFLGKGKQFTDVICTGNQEKDDPSNNCEDIEKFGCQMKVTVKPHNSTQIFWSMFEERKESKSSPKGILDICKKNAEEFYNQLLQNFSPEQKLVARQAFAGLLWNKQLYCYDVGSWRKNLDEYHLNQYRWLFPHGGSFTMEDVKILMESPCCDLMKEKEYKGFVAKHKFKILKQELAEKSENKKINWDVLCRNKDWTHLSSYDVLAVPDKWEFPWFATWDTAFQMVPYARLDPGFAKNQLLLFLSEKFMKDDGQMPGCEWDMDIPFPPVYAWSCYHVFSRTGHADKEFLKQSFQKLQLNYQWWLKSMHFRNNRYLFTGGFLGLDNISIVDRSYHLKQGYPLIQADATGWMAFFSLSMFEIALTLSAEPGADHKFYRACVNYLDKFISIAEAMNRSISDGGLWNPHDKFYYDVIETESGDRTPVALRSLVGIIPALACLNIKMSSLKNKPGKKILEKLENLMEKKSPFIDRNEDGDFLLCAVPKARFHNILKHLTDEEEFLSPFGIRSLSKVYEMDPYSLKVSKEVQEYLDLDDKTELKVTYAPAESDTGLMGGNSNWRGPIWLCMNFMIVEMLMKMDSFYGDKFRMIHPSLSGTAMRLGEMAGDICSRVSSLFTVNSKTQSRPCHGSYEKYKHEESWRDLVLFYEYFDSETGRGCGASHQTGWTALIVEFLDIL